MSETLLSEQDISLSSSEQCSRGIRLMIIELRKYNEIRELLIENRTTGSQAQVSYRDVYREASVTRMAVRMGVKEMEMQTEYRDACNWSPSQDPDQECMWTLRSN